VQPSSENQDCKSTLWQSQSKAEIPGPDGREFIPSPDIDVNVVPNENADYNSLNFVLNLQPMKLDKIGKYAIELYYDGEFHSGLTLTVVQSIPVQRAA
jgi:hypothetical protein